MKILHYILCCFYGVKVNALQETTFQTQNENNDYLITVITPMIAVILLIIFILIACYCVFKKSMESTDFESREDEEERPLLENHDEINNDRKSQSSSGNFENKMLRENLNKGSSDREKLLSHSKSFQSTETYQSDQSSISYDFTGLQNESNECYMNCVIQSLASSEYVIKQLESIYKELPDSSLLENTIKLIDGLNNTKGKTNAQKNSNLLKTILDLIKWTKTSQQDAFEFLCALINKIHEEMKEIKRVKLEPPLKIELLHRIGGMSVPDKVQYHIGLSVGLCGNYQDEPGVTIEFLIKEYFAVSYVDDDDTKTTQLYFHKQIPQVLLIHIQANKWMPQFGKLVKPTYYIQYREELVIDLPVHENGTCEKENIKYNLVAVIHHMGDLHNGHYITYRKFRKKWLLTNDTQVEQKSFNKNICPYILLYEKDSK